MHERIAIHLTRGSEEEASTVGERAVEQCPRARATYGEDLERHGGEVVGRGRTGEIHHGIEAVT